MAGLLLVTALQGVHGQPAEFPASTVEPLLDEDSFHVPPHTLNAAPANGWLTTLGGGGAFAEVRNTRGFPFTPGLDIVEFGLGARTTASGPLVPTPGGANYSIAWTMEFLAFRVAGASFATAACLSNDQTQGSGNRFCMVFDEFGEIHAPSATGFFLVLNVPYLFVFGQISPGQGLGNLNVFVNSTNISLPRYPTLQLLGNVATTMGGPNFSLDLTASASARFVADWYSVGIPEYTTDPDEGPTCEDLFYSTTVLTDAAEDIRAGFTTNPGWATLANAPSNTTASGFDELTVSGIPVLEGTNLLNVTLFNAVGERSMAWNLTVQECGSGPVFGYSGISAEDPCGATYFNTATGHVRPVPCGRVLLALDMETLDANGELHDFALDQTGTLNHTATRNGANFTVADFGAGQDFDGTANLTLNGDVSELGRPNSWTAHWWLLVNDDASNRTLWAKWENVDSLGGWYFEVTGGNQVLVSWGGTDNHTFSQQVPRGVEFPLTLTYEFPTGALSLFVNGTISETTTFLNRPESEAAGVDPVIGEANNQSFGYNGTLDEFLLWAERAMTADQVLGLSTPFPRAVQLGLLEPPDETVSGIDLLLPGIITVAAIVGTFFLMGFVLWRLFRGGLEQMKNLASRARKGKGG